MYTYQYPHPALTADCVVFGYEKKYLHVLLIRRKHPPCMDMWAFPGGFMNIDEDVESCARRELNEETGLIISHLYQFGVYSAPERDPRERVVSVAYYTLLPLCEVCGSDDAAEARWFPVDNLPPLAFDHGEMFNNAMESLKMALRVLPVGKDVLPQRFTINQFADLYESVCGIGIEKERLQSRLIEMGVVDLMEDGLICYKR